MEPFKSAQPVSDTPASAPEVIKKPDSVAAPVEALKSNPSLGEYTADKGQPYANEYFETGTPFDYLPTDAQKSLSDIDKFVDMEIGERGWKDNLSNYNKIITELKYEMGLAEVDGSELIDILGAYARNMLKIRGIDDIKADLKRQLKKLKRAKDMDGAVLKAIGRKIL